MSRFYSETLADHDRAAFSSGNERIDRYFQHTVSQDVKRSIARCFVLVERETGRLAGFYSLSSHSIALTELAPELIKKLPRYPSVPAVLIGWLGRDQLFRGQSVGSLLLADAITRLATAPLGIHAICADAIDAPVAAFYQAHQFTPFVSRPRSFYLPMKTALALMAPDAHT